MDPINYNIDVQSPMDSVLKGFQGGLAINQAMQQQAQQKYAFQQQQQMQSDLANLSTNKNAGAQDYAQMAVKYPQLADHFKKTWDMLNADQQRSQLSHTTQVYAALQAGKPEIAAQLLKDQSIALKNSGKDQDAHAADTLSQLVTGAPDQAKTVAGLMLSSVMGPDKFAATFGQLGDQQRKNELQPAEVTKATAEAAIKQAEARNTPQRLALEGQYKGAQIRDIDSQIGDRAGKLGLDRDKLQSEVELKLYELTQKSNPAFNLDDGAKKLINDSTIASTAADQSSSQIIGLATKLENQGGGYGAFGTASEWIKKVTGNQDGMTQLRNEYVRIRNSQAMKMLPPGSASDKDVAMAMGGFPPETADAKTMASFLRGMAKLNQYTAVSENAKAEWVNAVGHLGKPKTDITVDGVNVPAGSTFTDFARQYMETKAANRGVEQARTQVPNRSYMRWAQPGQQ